MKQNTTLRLLVPIIAIFSLFGCGQKDFQTFTKTQDGITATFSISPASPVAMESVTLSLSLTDANGKVIEGAQVAYDLTMPGMTMPPNQPQVTAQGEGEFLADAILTMSGDWRAEVTVAYDGKTTTFSFDFSVK
jgi:nitrogen fixation protein FixH